MNKELEEAIKVLNMWNKAEEFVINDKDDFNKEPYIQRKQAIETVLNYIENSIPKKKVEDKIEKLNDIKSEYSQRVIYSKTSTFTELAQEILKELLEDK